MEMNNSFLDDYDQMEEDYILIKEQKRKKKKDLGYVWFV